MAEQAATFRRFFRNRNDPFVPRGSLLASFDAATATQPALLLSRTMSTEYPLPLLMSGTNHEPVLAIAPFDRALLPGMAPPAFKYALCGDVTDGGAMPGLLQVNSDSFHQTGQCTVLERADATAAWTAAGPDVLLLEPPAVGANTHQVTSRRSMPIPHEYAEVVLDQHAQGSLSWRWLWQAVAVPMLADAGRTQDYALFLDYLQVASTQRAGLNAGDPARGPATELDYAGVLTTRGLQDRALSIARQFLPGLRQPIGIGAQMAAVQQGQTQLQEAVVAARQPRVVTIQESNPLLYPELLKLNEVSDEAGLALYWSMHPQLKAGQWGPAMDLAVTNYANAHGGGLLAPTLMAALCTDIGSGKYSGTNGDVTQGFNIFRIKSGNSPHHSTYANRNQVYAVMSAGTGTVQAGAVEMIMENSEIELPETIEHMRGIIEGYYVVLACFAGTNNRAVNNFYQNVVQCRTMILTELDLLYPDPVKRKVAFVKILTYIYRVFNDYFKKLAANQVPTAAGVPAVGAPATAPSFDKIAESIADGTVLTITEVPEMLLECCTPAGLMDISQAEEGGGPPRAPAGPARPAPDAGDRAIVKKPEQNLNLKRAWVATGHPNIFYCGWCQLHASAAHSKDW